MSSRPALGLVIPLCIAILGAAVASGAAATSVHSTAAGSSCSVVAGSGSVLSSADSALACRFAPRLVFTPGEAYEERDLSIALAPVCDGGTKMPAKLLAFRKTKWFPHWKLQEKVVFSSEHPTLQRLVDAFGVVRGGWPSPPPSDGLLTIDEPGASSDWRLHRKNELQILSGNAGCAASSDPYPLTVYVHVRHGSTLEAIEYWFFYYYDAWNLWSLHQTHEGDWEHITVFLRRKAHNGPEAALPVGVQYAWHKDSSTIAWPETERCSDPCTLPTSPAPAPPSQEHPLVFVGLGSHASYPFQDTWFPSTIAMGERIEGADVATGDTVSPAARLVALGTNDRSFLPNLPISGEKRGRPGGAQLMWGERGSRVPYWSEIHGSGPLSPQQQGDISQTPRKGRGRHSPSCRCSVEAVSAPRAGARSTLGGAARRRCRTSRCTDSEYSGALRC